MQFLTSTLPILTIVLLFLLFILLILLLKLTKPPPTVRRGRLSSNPDVHLSPTVLEKMSSYNIPEAQVLDTFFHGEKRVSKAGKDIMVKDHSEYRVVVGFDRRPDGKWKIYSIGKYPVLPAIPV